MQPNYDYWDERRASAPGFMNPPAIDNSIQDVDVPVIYSPYPTAGFWPGYPASVAPNSAQGTTVANSTLSALGALHPGISPASLVARMPSIVRPNTPATANATCQIANWVSGNIGLAILAALGVFALAASGGRS
jgi:hypothetical protein